jgi:hypothetical protein
MAKRFTKEEIDLVKEQVSIRLALWIIMKALYRNPLLLVDIAKKSKEV